MAADQRPLPGARCPPLSERRSQPCRVLKAAGTRTLLSPHQKAPPAPPCCARLTPALLGPRGDGGRATCRGPLGPVILLLQQTRDDVPSCTFHIRREPGDSAASACRRLGHLLTGRLGGHTGRRGRDRGTVPKAKPSREWGAALPPPLLRDAWGASGQDAGTHCARGLVRWEQRWVVAATGRGRGAPRAGEGGAGPQDASADEGQHRREKRRLGSALPPNFHTSTEITNSA